MNKLPCPRCGKQMKLIRKGIELARTPRRKKGQPKPKVSQRYVVRFWCACRKEKHHVISGKSIANVSRYINEQLAKEKERKLRVKRALDNVSVDEDAKSPKIKITNPVRPWANKT